MTKYRILYWKHIPSAIIVQGDGRKIKTPLPDRFQRAIDAYATVTGLTSTDEYLDAWHRSDWIEREGTPEEVSQALLSELEITFAKIEIPKRKT
jgi:Virulence factor